jgi:serine protease Do
MNFKKAFQLVGFLALGTGIALAQQTAPAPLSPGTPRTPGEPPMAFSLYLDEGSFLGVHTEDINKENMARYNMREVRGVGVTQVVKDSPAEKAGLRKDDVIVRFEGDSVTSVRKLTRLVSEVAPDQSVRLVISRGGSEQEVAVTMGKRDNSMTSFRRLEELQGLEGFKDLENFKGLGRLKELHKGFPPGAQVWKWEGPGDGNFVYSFGNHRRIGVSTMDLTKQLADYFGIADGKGVLVTAVSEDSPAAKAGVKAGDVIISIDGEKVDGAGDLSRGINKKKDGDVTLTLIRNKNQRNVTVTPKEFTPAAVPGAVPRVSGRRVTVPRIELGSIPAVNVTLPQITLPIIPEINIEIPDKVVKPRVVRSTQPTIL